MKRFDQLPVASSVAGTDLVPIMQGGVTKQVAASQLIVGTRVVVPEAATLTLNFGSDQDSTASGTLNEIAFQAGTPTESTASITLRLFVTSGPYTLTIPTSWRLNETTSTTSVTFQNGSNALEWTYSAVKWWLVDTGDTIPITYTVATLPAGTLGLTACVTDGDSGLGWGDTVTDTGSNDTPYLVWYNGGNWKVYAK